MIQIPDGWARTKRKNIVERLLNGEKLLATLSDDSGIYAVQVYSKEYNNVQYDLDFKEYLQSGQWYQQKSE